MFYNKFTLSQLSQADCETIKLIINYNNFIMNEKLKSDFKIKDSEIREKFRSKIPTHLYSLPKQFFMFYEICDKYINSIFQDKNNILRRVDFRDEKEYRFIFGILYFCGYNVKYIIEDPYSCRIKYSFTYENLISAYFLNNTMSISWGTKCKSNKLLMKISKDLDNKFDEINKKSIFLGFHYIGYITLKLIKTYPNSLYIDNVTITNILNNLCSKYDKLLYDISEKTDSKYKYLDIRIQKRFENDASS